MLKCVSQHLSELPLRATKALLFLLALFPVSGISNVEAATLYGTVYGGSDPLAEVTVNLFDTSTGDIKGRQLTTSSGFYEFVIDDGEYRLQILPSENSGFDESYVNNIVVNDSDVKQNVLLIEDSGFSQTSTVSGLLKMPDGTPVQEVWVSAQGNEGTDHYASGRTDAQGAYSLSLVPGSYAIRVYTSDTAFIMQGGDYVSLGISTYDSVIEDSLEISADTVLDDKILPFVLVNGKTTDENGVALAGTQITAEKSGDEEYSSGYLHSALSDDNGNYLLALPIGTYRVSLQFAESTRGVGSSQYTDLDFSTDESRDFAVEINQTVALSGVVKMPDGTPIQEAWVSVQGNEGTDYTASGNTDAQGVYSLPLLPGDYSVRVHTSYSAFIMLEGDSVYLGDSSFDNVVDDALEIASDTVLDDMVLPIVLVSGQTTDDNGVPLAQVDVKAELTSAVEYSNGDPNRTTSDEDGNYVLALPVGTYSVSLQFSDSSQGVGGADYTDLRFLIDENRDFAVTVNDALALSGIVRMPDGTPVQDVWLSVTGIEGTEYYLSSRTDAQGVYSLSVLPGSYSMRVYTNQSAFIMLEGKPVSLGDYSYDEIIDENLEVLADVALDDLVMPYVYVSGQTSDSNGLAIGNINITTELSDDDGEFNGYRSQVSSDSEGNYLLLLPEGDFDLSIFPDQNNGFKEIRINNLSYTSNTLQNISMNHIDEKAPRIVSSPVVSSVTDSTAQVEWQTDEPATSEVIVNGVSFTVPGLHTGHAVPLSDLLAGTVHDVQVVSSDSAGNGPTMSQTVVFKTKTTPDLVPPVMVKGPVVSSISRNTAVVKWVTNEPAKTSLDLIFSNETSTLELEGFRTEHKIELSDLQPLTQYTIVVNAEDAKANAMEPGAPREFRTLAAPDVDAPIIVGWPLVTNVTDSEASIEWKTEEPSTSGLSLKQGDNYTVYGDDELTTNHEIRLTGLLPSSEYDYTVSSTDSAGNGPILSETQQFTTRLGADAQAPVLVKPPVAHGLSRHNATIHWKTDEPASVLVEYGLVLEDLDLVSSRARLKKNHVLRLVDLLEDTEYFYRTRSTDSSGNERVSNLASFTTSKIPDDKKPVFTQLPKIEGRTDTTATISWQTDEPTTAVLEYGKSQNITSRKNSAELSTRHQFTLAGLLPGEVYSFIAYSEDVSGNAAKHSSYAQQQLADSESTDSDSQDDATAVLEDIIDSSDTGFATNLLPDTIAPDFSVVPAIVSVAADHAILRWQSDEIASYTISYGLSSGAQDFTIGEVEYGSAPLVVLPNLLPEESYTATISLIDVAGNRSITDEIVFTTLSEADGTVPEILPGSSIRATQDNTLVASWETDEFTTGQLACVSDTDAEVRRARSEDMQLRHELELNELLSDARYTCTITSSDLTGNTVALEAIVTMSDVAPVIETPVAVDPPVVPVGTDKPAEETDPEAPIVVVDTDGDGVIDSEDAFPLASDEWLDTDKDNIGNNADTDDDNDGLPDGFEFSQGLDPLFAGDASADLDKDGLSNLIEYQAGRQLDKDDVSPILLAPFDIVIDSTGLLTSVAIGTASAIDMKDGNLNATVDSDGNFAPGRHSVTWSAIDATGNRSTAVQIIDVVPQVAFVSKGMVEEGDTLTLEFHLNGEAAEYPVVIPYVISGDAIPGLDYEMRDGEAIIESGTLGTVDIQTLQDDEMELREKLIVTLGTPENAVRGNQPEHTVFIVDENVAPRLSVTALQNGRQVSTVYTDKGMVSVRARVVDVNQLDTHSYDWSGSNDNLLAIEGYTNSEFLIDPSTLANGTYELKLRVTDSGSPTQATTISDHILVKQSAPVLSIELDTDKDGLPDAYEGFGDADLDRVPDYLDNNNDTHLLSTRDGGAVMQASPGISLRLGDTSFGSGSISPQIAIADLPVGLSGEGSVDEKFEFLSGVFDFEIIGGLSGESQLVVLPLEDPLGGSSVYRKYDVGSGLWRDFDVDAFNIVSSAPGNAASCPSPGSDEYVSGLVEGFYCVQLQIQDGGPNDADGVANGSIKDPGAVASPRPDSTESAPDTVNPDVDGEDSNGVDESGANNPDGENAPPVAEAAPEVFARTGSGSLSGLGLLVLAMTGLLKLRSRRTLAAWSLSENRLGGRGVFVN